MLKSAHALLGAALALALADALALALADAFEELPPPHAANEKQSATAHAKIDANLNPFMFLPSPRKASVHKVP